MTRNRLFFWTLALLAACGGGDSSYTETEYWEAFFLADCNMQKKCDATEYGVLYTSVEECVTDYRQENDTSPEDVAVTYEPICDGDEQFNPEEARKYVECLSAQSCEEWESGNRCEGYRESTCMQLCEALNDGYARCINDRILRCSGGKWLEEEDCAAIGMHCERRSLPGSAACYDNCSPEEDSASRCSGDWVEWCNEGKWTMIWDCAQNNTGTCQMVGEEATCTGAASDTDILPDTDAAMS